MSKPLIGITADAIAYQNTLEGAVNYFSRSPYAAAIAQAGGLPVLLPYEATLIPEYLDRLDGILLSGGDDPNTEKYGEAVHQEATLILEERQAFEEALLAALDEHTIPVLGVCLGMQMMALHAGGALEQFLPDVLDADAAATHHKGEHAIKVLKPHPLLENRSVVFSRHRQAVKDAGNLEVIATDESGEVVEAILKPGERFYLGIQWHPERTAGRAAGMGLLEKFVTLCG